MTVGAGAACLTDEPMVGTPVVLSAVDSYDPDAGPEALTYRWTQVCGPAVKLDGAATAEVTFTPSEGGLYVFELQIADGQDVVANAVEVFVLDRQPFARAGGQ